jgi:hypothetical protein
LTGATTGPALDEPLLRERFERVALVYLDAFGSTFLERQGDHPLLRRARSDGLVAQLTSQFPSTTTAHVTTIHSGLPVAEHGLYEWHVLEPTLNRLITPLLFSFSGDSERETLAGLLDPEDVYPAESLHVRLAASGVRSSVAQPAAIAHLSPNRVLLRGADVLPFSVPEEGLAAAAAALAAAETAHAHVYLEGIDALMHAVGPDEPAADVAFAEALTAIERAPFPSGTLVLLTADQGMSRSTRRAPSMSTTSGPSSQRTSRRARTESRSRRPARAATSSFTSATDSSTRCATDSATVSTGSPTSSLPRRSSPTASSPSRHHACGPASATSSSCRATARRSTGTSPAASRSTSTASQLPEMGPDVRLTPPTCLPTRKVSGTSARTAPSACVPGLAGAGARTAWCATSPHRAPAAVGR